MKVKRLLLQNFRNIQYLDIELNDNFNLIFGDNGSGKTSFIEALSYLSLGRSFRSAKYQSLITDSASKFTISARVENDNSIVSDNLGISRDRARNSSIQISINNKSTNRLLDIVDRLCVQIIHPQGIELVTGTPENRRNFIDWGVYYMFPDFKDIWFRYRKILLQRNTLLKKNSPLSEISIWDDLLCELSEKITFYRESYLSLLQETLTQKISKFLPSFKIDFSLAKGWENRMELRSLLRLNLEKDRNLGYTFYGCHRADLKIKSNQNLVCDTLSRGQLKLLVCAMRLAQGHLLRQEQSKRCIYLIDDLNSELDPNSRNVFLKELFDCESQVFITNISNSFELADDTRCSYIDIAKEIQLSA